MHPPSVGYWGYDEKRRRKEDQINNDSAACVSCSVDYVIIKDVANNEYQDV